MGYFGKRIGFYDELFRNHPHYKKNRTTSFTLASGGISILALAFFYWIIDVKGYKKNWLQFFAVVGTNSIFIYLFAETFGHLIFREFDILWNTGLFHPLEEYKDWLLVLESLLILLFLWYITYYLDKRKIYFKV
ncbi:hypothetical protein NYZ99_19815 [Maribacter litopenaei]|uniref:Lycopene cyclase domain-containing protein n=1 Tax=Maribacter litopenaei TaxID=2976127 RepID=A0ABY5Y7E0_9FLAO|nr:hypothetical protein [Maribacter litopenaei]UWX54943.1 hypothetical protein NYZ99_19815 [Maribacter litopenaei]